MCCSLSVVFPLNAHQNKLALYVAVPLLSYKVSCLSDKAMLTMLQMYSQRRLLLCTPGGLAIVGATKNPFYHFCGYVDHTRGPHFNSRWCGQYLGHNTHFSYTKFIGM